MHIVLIQVLCFNPPHDISFHIDQQCRFFQGNKHVAGSRLTHSSFVNGLRSCWPPFESILYLLEKKKKTTNW